MLVRLEKKWLALLFKTAASTGKMESISADGSHSVIVFTLKFYFKFHSLL